MRLDVVEEDEMGMEGSGCNRSHGRSRDLWVPVVHSSEFCTLGCEQKRSVCCVAVFKQGLGWS